MSYEDDRREISIQSDAFHAAVPELIAAGHGGRWAVWRDGLIGLYGDQEAALSAGYDRFGLEGPVFVVSRVEIRRTMNLSRWPV